MYLDSVIRHSTGFVFSLIALLALPQSANAQLEWDLSGSEPDSAEPEDPDVAASGSKVAGPEAYVRRAKTGVIASSVLFGAGAALTGGLIAWSQKPGDFPDSGAMAGAAVGATVAVAGIGPYVAGMRASDCVTDAGGMTQSKRCENLRIAGGTLMITGALGLIAQGIVVGVRGRQVRKARAV